MKPCYNEKFIFLHCFPTEHDWCAKDLYSLTFITRTWSISNCHEHKILTLNLSIMLLFITNLMILLWQVWKCA